MNVQLVLEVLSIVGHVVCVRFICTGMEIVFYFYIYALNTSVYSFNVKVDKFSRMLILYIINLYGRSFTIISQQICLLWISIIA